ncbi:MAG: hypothetical protein ABIF04_00430 [Chloroflexota bacterium]
MNQLNLKELERKAFRSTYQDGLRDLYYGLIVICVSIFVYRPASGYSPLNIVLAMSAMGVAYALFWAGKKFITLPRMGQVQFGTRRKKRKLTLVIVLGVVVLIQIVFLVFQLLAWANPELGAKLNGFIQERNIMDLAVASIGALFVGPSMVLVAYFTDFPRGYYIATLFSLAVFLMIYLNQPIYPIIIGVLISLPGLVLFVRFLQKYPLLREESHHE